jgi:hypothetical protein
MPQQEKSNKQDKVFYLDPHVKKLFQGDGFRFMRNDNGGGHKTADHDQRVGKFIGNH